jgi:hypothetical protein
MAASARRVASFSAGWLSAPASSRVGQRRLDRLDRAGGIRDAEAGLVEDEAVDGARQGGPAQGAAGPVGVAPERHRPAGPVGDGLHHGGHVPTPPMVSNSTAMPVSRATRDPTGRSSPDSPAGSPPPRHPS